MPQKLKVEGPAPPEEVAVARLSHADPHDQERLLAIQMAQHGRLRVADIAAILGRGTATIGRWLRQFRSGGISAVLKRQHGVRKPQLNPEVKTQLLAGLREGRWKTTPEIRQWLKQAHNISLSQAGVYYWLNKVNARKKLPRRHHRQQDPKAIETFKQNIMNVLLQLEIPKDQRIRVWIEDEHRYGLISTVRRCWSVKGHRPTVPVQIKYQWGYVYGACEAILGKAEFLYLPTVSLDKSRLFLEQLVATDPEALHIVFWDQAGFHPKPDDPQLPESVRLIPLPPYSPELNAMEQVWDPVKCRVSNAVWETLDAIESAITEALKPFWEFPERVWSLLGDSWLTRGVSRFLQLRKAII